MLTFDEAKHEYTFAGRVVPSVTTIIKEAGCMGDTSFFTDEARDRGTEVHKIVEAYIKYGDDECPELLRGYLDAYRAFERDMKPVVEESEVKLYYSQGGIHYAGTGDLFLMLDHMLTYLDIKTGSKAKWHGLQSAAYVEAFWQMRNKPVLRRGCLYLEGDGTYRLGFHNDKNDTAVFMAAAALANWTRQ